MKTLRYLGICASVLALAACSKNVTPEIVCPNPDPSTPSTLTFTVSIDDNATKAWLSGLDIKWGSADYVGVASDVSDDVVVYALNREKEGSSKGTLTINTVEGATSYYAIYNGSSDLAGITFDHSTLTFSGMSISHNTNLNTKASLTMVGKTDGTSLLVKPCLSIIKYKIAAASVASQYDSDGYSGVGGVRIYLRNKGTQLIIGGSYTVSFTGSGNEFTVSGSEASGNWREQSSGSLLSSSSQYGMALIPAGEVTDIEISFIGWNSLGSYWAVPYSMKLHQELSFDPGDCFDFGTLDPLTLQKAADSATRLVTVDGAFDDWASVEGTTYDDTWGKRTTTLKTLTDGSKVWSYVKIVKDDGTAFDFSSGERYFYLYYDTDNDSSTGLEGGYEFRLLAQNFVDTDGTAVSGFSPAFYQAGTSWNYLGSTKVDFAATVSSDLKTIEAEFGFSLPVLGADAGDTIRLYLLGFIGNDSPNELVVRSSFTVPAE